MLWLVWWAWWAAAGAHELDPAACAARFDVQRDKIIRTEESREMGARYLSELDVGARQECLRLCCETEACDVFVFEEKSPGSCYLFNCGPPEDFRCKFTAHGNFSSGVLALSRRLAELQDQERLAKHEQDLANLRSPTSSTASTTAAASPAPPPPAPPRQPPPPPPRRCSRYQFECRRGGECIAVYNACDGVAQCADGSDEAPELGCPASPPPPPAAPPVAPPSARTRPLATRPPPPPPAPPLTQVQAAESAEEGGTDVLAEGAGGVGGGGMWPPRLAQAQPQHRYNTVGVSSGGSHIFSHKGGLLQESPAFEPPLPAAGWPRHAWPPPQTGMDSMSAPHAWAPYPQPAPDWDVEPRRAWPVPPRPEPEMPVYMPPKTMPEMPIVYSSQQQTLRDSPKKGFDLMSKNHLEAGTEPPPPAPRLDPAIDLREEKKPVFIENTTKKKMLKDPVLDENHKAPAAGEHKAASVAAAAGPGGASGTSAAAASMAAVHAQLAADERDGLSEHPPAAVLLLVLGTLMTGALGTLLACRARAARRRRRAHPRYALDADYLVNGMYL